jgi:PAS domain S-box-containing protein
MAMIPQEPLPLHHSWPLFDAETRLGIAGLSPFVLGPTPSPHAVGTIDSILAARGVGVWECDLRDNRLTWTAGVYDLFGLPRGMALERGLTVSIYRPHSRVAMEELRAHAIRHKRGFTVDVELRQPDGDERWMRLSAVPVLGNGKVVRLCGLKIDVTAEYDMEMSCAKQS